MNTPKPRKAHLRRIILLYIVPSIIALILWGVMKILLPILIFLLWVGAAAVHEDHHGKEHAIIKSKPSRRFSINFGLGLIAAIASFFIIAVTAPIIYGALLVIHNPATAHSALIALIASIGIDAVMAIGAIMGLTSMGYVHLDSGMLFLIVVIIMAASLLALYFIAPSMIPLIHPVK